MTDDPTLDLRVMDQLRLIPDLEPKRPKKVDPMFELPDQEPTTMDGWLQEAVDIVEFAKETHDPVRTFLLFSGGTDSLTLLESVGHLADEIVHINTGIGIPETNQFCQDVVSGHFDRPLTVLHPPRPYDELVLNDWSGFPGPGAHRLSYVRLKERPIEQLLRDHRTKRGQRFLLLTGIRNKESVRRMGYSDPVERKGGQVWTSPILRISDEAKRELLDVRGTPKNEVSAHLHMSGECLCGAFAKPGELDEIGFFYPHVKERINDLERQARKLGLAACVWGERPPKKNAIPAGPMCVSCTLWGEEDEDV